MMSGCTTDFTIGLEDDVAQRLPVLGYVIIRLIYPNGRVSTFDCDTLDELVERLFDDSLRYRILDIDRQYGDCDGSCDDIVTYLFIMAETGGCDTNIDANFIAAARAVLAGELR